MKTSIIISNSRGLQPRHHNSEHQSSVTTCDSLLSVSQVTALFKLSSNFKCFKDFPCVSAVMFSPQNKIRKFEVLNMNNLLPSFNPTLNVRVKSLSVVKNSDGISYYEIIGAPFVEEFDQVLNDFTTKYHPVTTLRAPREIEGQVLDIKSADIVTLTVKDSRDVSFKSKSYFINSWTHKNTVHRVSDMIEYKSSAIGNTEVSDNPDADF